MARTQATSIKPQAYSQIVYDTTATQANNIYTNITDFFNAISSMAKGTKTLTILSSVTAPSGAWNTEGCVFEGNGSAYDAGGITITFATGTTLTGASPPKFTKGIRARSTSSSNIYTGAGGYTFNVSEVATIQSTTAAFFKSTTGGQDVIAAGSSARFLNDGYENYESTAGAFASTIVINYQLGVAVRNNTLRSTNSQVYVQVLDTVSMDASGFPTTHTNLSVGFGLLLNRNYSPNLSYQPVTKTANYTVTKSNGHFRGDATSASFTFTLPAATGTGYTLSFKKIDSSANTVTIDGNGSETIDGATTYVLSTQYQGVTIMDVATGVWDIVS